MEKKSYADMDPLEEIRAIKEEISRKFKTARAYGEYLRKKRMAAGGPAPEVDSGIGSNDARQLTRSGTGA